MKEFLGERGLFGEDTKVHTGHSLLDEPSALDNCSLVHHEITWFATSPISVMGVAMNIVVLLVWSVKERHQPIIFLFKVLAVMDITYILSLNVWWYSPVQSMLADVMSCVVSLSQYMLVNTTVLICIWRWISIFKQERSRNMQTRFRIRLAISIVVSYCTVVVVVKKTVAYVVDDQYTVAVVSVVVANIMLSAPLILLTVLTASMVWALNTTANDKVNPELSSTGHIHFHCHSLRGKSKIRRLTYCIISVAVSTFIAYPLSQVVTAYFKLESNPDNKCAKKIAFAVTYLLYIVNSSLPFLFYFAFMIKFRKMFLLRFITFYLGNYSTNMGSETEGQSETGVFSPVTEGASKFHPQQSYRPSLVVVAEDGTLTISKAHTPNREEGKERSGKISSASTSKWNRASF